MDSISKRNKRKSGFKSYITIGGNFQERAIDVPKEPPEDTVEPFLFEGEILIARADNVHKCSPLKSSKVGGILGTLFVTSFKISFVTSSLPVDTKENELVYGSLQSDFLGLHDVCLTEIDSIYSLSEGLKKKTRLSSSSPLPNKIPGILLLLKNLRSVYFDFRLTPADQDLKITKTICLHSHPKKIDLCFISLDTPPPVTEIPEFRTLQDWEGELRRTKCPNWRVSKQNEHYKVFPSLPSTFVVPHGIKDNFLATAAHHFRGNRPPVWCWGTPRGAALVRMAQLSPNITPKSSVENDLIKTIHKSHPKKNLQIRIIDLDRELPSLKSIHASYLKLRDLHMPDSLNAFQESERNYLSRWQTSGWLTHVHDCLRVSQYAAAALVIDNSTVILQEGEGRDWSCVVSCLIQILLDPYARTLRGFHTLIQKEWVALGHQFAQRLGHLKQSSDELSPLWLFFLDCVHQIGVQYPSALEFTQDYLMALWQASHCSLHSTFMFDSQKEEIQALQTLREAYQNLRDEVVQTDIYFWPVWSWWSRVEGPRLAQLRAASVPPKERSLTPHNVAKDGLLKQNRQRNSSSGHCDVLRAGDEPLYLLTGREMRSNLRRKFINVLYIQSLLQPLLSSKHLSRLTDRLASAHSILNRLFHVVGRADTPLPYDVFQPPPMLELDLGLKIILDGRTRPWVECFGMWMNDPAPQFSQGDRYRPIIAPQFSLEDCYRPVIMSQLSQVEHNNKSVLASRHSQGEDSVNRPIVEPCNNGLDLYWSCVYDIVSMLQNISTVSQNGADS